MLKTDLAIQTYGKPSLQAMPESERRSFLVRCSTVSLTCNKNGIIPKITTE